MTDDLKRQFHDRIETEHWRFGFRPFAADRCAPFFLDAGVPVEIAEMPEKLRDVARSMLKDPLPSEKGGSSRASVDALNDRTFALLGSAYTPASVQEFHAWLSRHETDAMQHRRWAGWTCVYLRFSATRPDRDLAGGGPVRKIAEVIDGRFAPEPWTHLERRIEAARTNRLSQDEEALLLSEWAAGAGEEAQPADELDQVALWIGEEHAYSAWRELTSRFSRAELAWFNAWARSVAPGCGWTARSIADEFK